jgi:hypothetical protein
MVHAESATSPSTDVSPALQQQALIETAHGISGYCMPMPPRRRRHRLIQAQIWRKEKPYNIGMEKTTSIPAFADVHPHSIPVPWLYRRCKG